MSMVKKWFEGMGLRVPVKSREQRIKELLEDEDVLQLMKIAYIEGGNHVLSPRTTYTFEELKKYLKQ